MGYGTKVDPENIGCLPIHGKDAGMARKKRGETPEPKSANSAMDTVLDNIKDMFLNGKLKPGDLMLPENELAKSMNVSRGSVREAMKILDAFGLVEIKRGNGTYVADGIKARNFDPLMFQLVFAGKDFRHVVELRQCLELEVVRLVIQHGTRDDFKALHAAIDDMEDEIERDTIDTARIFHHEIIFHGILGDATHNPLMSRIYRFVIDFFAPMLKATANTIFNDSGRSSLQLHKNILAAIEARDIVGVEYEIVESIRAWQRTYTKFLG